MKRVTNGRQQLRVAVSGSFHRHMAAITAAVQELASLSVRVLSPADPRVVAQQGEFLFVASDRVRSVRLVQDRHLESIRAADFVWLVCPDGYVGQSASMEVGFAAASGVPIYSMHPPADLTLREYVTVARTLRDVLHAVAARARTRNSPGLLIDPRASLEEAHATLDRIESGLREPARSLRPADRVREDLAALHATLMLPTYVQ
jgi:hypothetical protein